MIQPERTRRRAWLRSIIRFTAAAIVFLSLALLFWMRDALYNRLVRFPNEEASWQAIRAQLRPVPENAGWVEYRGIMHTHSILSHDCEVPFEEILRVLKTTKLDFICLSDHCNEGRADFSAQWRGLHDGKLFVPGYEMRQGFMPFGVASGVVLSNATDSITLARQITENGGLLFYAHPEEERDWNCPELVGMEIYNTHSDLKRSRGYPSLLPDLLLNHRRYPEHVIYSIMRRPSEFLQRWDELNHTRHITGIAGNDCHQNTGIRGFYTRAGTLQIEDTSPKKLKELKLNWFTRTLARLFFGPLDPGRELFHFQLDPYERVARMVNTHVLARELTEPAILDGLKAGRVFVGFDMIADSAGFRFFAVNGTNSVVMGEATVYSDAIKLHALSPCPCRFTVIRDGVRVFQQEGYGIDWTPGGPGKYRVEAELRVAGAWVPWVYANPIQLTPAPSRDGNRV